jgi:hypothetical protein
LRDKDKQLIKNYLKHMGAQRVYKGGVFEIAWTLLTLRRHLTCNFGQAHRGKIEEPTDWLNDMEFTANTKSDRRYRSSIGYAEEQDILLHRVK